MAILTEVSKPIFNSNGVKILDRKFYNKAASIKTPKIQCCEIINNRGITAQFSTKTFENGNRFEVYRVCGDIVKVVKNKFGEIQKFSTNIKQQILRPEHLLRNIQDTFGAKINDIMR